MARMHARRRGKSGSSRPMISENPEWVPLSKEEIEEIVVKMGKDGVLSAKIGLVLRDQHSVPDVKLATGKTITQILKENNVAPNIPDDLVALMRTAINLQNHLNANKKDVANKRGMQITESKIRRLVKYYKRNGVLPADWQYSIANAELLIE
ncbi:30S ribosomal protein S15 [Candidatus Methanomassiliicoccus intestinalis]|uniref:30S ribosomal protein S15 n=1 Tax=Candidatus Methanomassiliicoccus intestinalis TaxID=1406512 RepID=UPI0037DCB194